MSDGGRERASIGVEVWKSSQKWSVQRSAVRSIAWLDLFALASPTLTTPREMNGNCEFQSAMNLVGVFQIALYSRSKNPAKDTNLGASRRGVVGHYLQFEANGLKVANAVLDTRKSATYVGRSNTSDWGFTLRVRYAADDVQQGLLDEQPQIDGRKRRCGVGHRSNENKISHRWRERAWRRDVRLKSWES